MMTDFRIASARQQFSDSRGCTDHLVFPSANVGNFVDGQILRFNNLKLRTDGRSIVMRSRELCRPVHLERGSSNETALASPSRKCYNTYNSYKRRISGEASSFDGP